MKKPKNLTLLYLENDEQFRLQTAAFLRENNINVIESDTIETANNLFVQNSIDLILIDLNLHEKNRMNFIRFLRNKDILAPLIITASDAKQEVLLDAINLDVTRFLVKPFEKYQLLEALEIASKKILRVTKWMTKDLGCGFSYDSDNKSIMSSEGKHAQLTKKESLLIELFLKNTQKLIPYDIIELYVWEDAYVHIDSLRTLVRSIRKKSYPKLFINYSGLGYKLNFSIP
ncbi:MAG: response regulator [Sulfurimonas sp.]|nr:response regulator [Sulfurimonas sp.]MDD3059834.1 response regulator [Sulfurimonas sp.]MDD5202170.1 response regulator [Sulfurimonas sp.]